MQTRQARRRDAVEPRQAGRSSAGPPDLDARSDWRRNKRLFQTAIYAAMIAVLTLYLISAGRSVLQIPLISLTALALTTLVAELAFAHLFRLRRRSALAANLLLHVVAAGTSEEACAQVIIAMRRLLQAKACFVALHKRTGELGVVASSGIGRSSAEYLLKLTVPPLGTEEADSPRRLHSRLISREIVAPNDLAIAVPLKGLRGIFGVLVMIGPAGGAMKDRRLLTLISSALGLPLENLRHKEELQNTLSLLSATMDSTADGILLVDQMGRIVRFNKRFAKMWGIPESIHPSWRDDEVLGMLLSPLVDPANFRRRLLGGHADPSDIPEVLKLLDGRIFECYSQTQWVDGQLAGQVLSFRDVTDRRQSDDTIRRLAYHDALTGLPNRALFTDRIGIALGRARRARDRLAVMFIDLDGFKVINDTLGHAAGDELLRAVGADLRELVRDIDTVARVGGDEFTVLLARIRSREVEVVANRILTTIRRPRIIGGKELRVTASVGAALFPEQGRDAETLLRHADTAMYKAKEMGRDTYRAYDPSIKAEALLRMNLQNDLRLALEREEFVLHYQPQVAVGTWDIAGAEALLRWQHPEGGLLGPGDFIPVAEESGLIVDIGDWVLRTACQANRGWQEAGLPPARVTVNLSARQFLQPDLAERVYRTLVDVALDPRYLELEITEGMTIQNPDSAAKLLGELRDMGVSISIDDFGTGYSSLAYLKRFPINRLKIDRSFVHQVTADPRDAAIAQTVIAMAHSLGLGVVAEGVERMDQLDFLVRHGCDEIQGYLVGRPVPTLTFESMLRRGGRYFLELQTAAR